MLAILKEKLSRVKTNNIFKCNFIIKSNLFKISVVIISLISHFFVFQ